ncbi:MAG: phenylalanine--tRNA ligase subunit alpha [Candidatus Blackburnbacteria bacterium RIFCSPHIGHO2_01_FULL_44_64]|uniref:Phenylalanine--tRNA ligase alpha subunit n=1 Tax=Candidatus Blackburnbacteria bacterium RIFCSPHIGHO2_02_FULL_44_20 TaxID=1797516 RepID=A0A1G1V7F5_9BACT|nr:MAG: phenylalanine--tRNA ligase subunit alpha [Candidatus Blackburnbacteria bacterium RIFCSPHIGHO2_01_FULL_44_64]OGY10209.1 MAG: phenylalanine--tRNA ligase subunit alpha [Candidatus Blackburnbacteria bacterium RIFCSPHIGHO2_12_FULL_44_25]OGY11350.1 MAG: phenylalanine--tRNA ligase subunit alpha [Candidatus Blackburnbacteria bacterium RIFCSPHIGHO2_02_FULL_44_20]OGY13526.1 MAG: phenylalanine--tRNA ligase subunit alpha [Candidatus Blackburnbacteria bacterium RIFCSPLOWO2_01_FULL_44_43]OGY15336.1 M
MDQKLHNLKTQAWAQINSADSVAELEQLRINYLGRNGELNKIAEDLKNLDSNQKALVGRIFNDTKNALENLILEKIQEIRGEEKKGWFDPTVPGIEPILGNLHLVTQAIEEISGIFQKIGFVRVRYPEVEWDWFAFEALNMPKDHPARDEWETFFVDHPEDKKYGKMVLTPHTSSGQPREMQRVKVPPIRMINIAKCYRRQSDNTHVPMFHQFEGLVIDKGINITHLKGTIDFFAKQFYGEKAVSRIRPFHFMFTEPSFEVDFSCVHCDGKGCRFCKSGWHEVGGAGMVHPNVLKAGGIDPTEYSGFAFGWGVERAQLLKPGIEIDDLRTLYSTDLRHLRQF